MREAPGSVGQPSSDTTSTDKPQFKPAIAGVTGTTTTAKRVHRPEPPIKKRTYLKSHFRVHREGNNKGLVLFCSFSLSAIFFDEIVVDNFFR